MSAADALAALAAGQKPAEEALLHNCLFEGWGGQAFGEEAILETFRAAPQTATEWDPIEGKSGAAQFGDGVALFADTVDGRLIRVWRLGPGFSVAGERSVFVPFDPDLAQARGNVIIAGATGAEHKLVEVAARDVLKDRGGYRLRAFALRVLRRGADAAVLFAIYRLGEGPERQCGFSYAAARLRIVGNLPTTSLIVRDLAGEAALASRPLLPRI